MSKIFPPVLEIEPRTSSGRLGKCSAIELYNLHPVRTILKFILKISKLRFKEIKETAHRHKVEVVEPRVES